MDATYSIGVGTGGTGARTPATVQSRMVTMQSQHHDVRAGLLPRALPMHGARLSRLPISFARVRSLHVKGFNVCRQRQRQWA